MQIKWLIKFYIEVSLDELYALLLLRETVFALEQNCVYQDIDGTDQHAIHVMGYHNQQLVAYARCYEKQDAIAIGRVLIAKMARGQGLGRELIQQCLHHIQNNLAAQQIILAAQHHLQKFYGDFGFIAQGEPYMEEGILHIDMHLHCM